MARLILMMLFVAALVLLARAILTVADRSAKGRGGGQARWPEGGPWMQKDVAMPVPMFRKIAYVLLVVLMFGVVTGWLGAA